jgi:isopentenyldiphosphate isomerase/intracellular septation protein A
MIKRKEIIKNFTLGFLPLIVFIIADELFGLTLGLIVAISFGMIQLFLSYIRERRFDRFILFDTFLILCLGLLSILLQNDIFFKIKPGLIGIILVVLLGISAFSNNKLLLKMSGRYLKDVQLSDQQIQIMQVMLKRMFFIFSIHTLLIFYAAFYLSKEAWGFISGGLFYLLMGVIFAFELVKTLWQKFQFKKKFGDEEWFNIVNPEGKILGNAPRSAVHGNPNLIHPVIHVHIVNSKGEIFLQKRSKNKEIQPDKWDTAIGGHIQAGETVDHALIREAEEELGISLGKFQPLFRYVMRNEQESELVHGFLLEEDGPFYPDWKEISEARFWTIEEIEDNLGKETFTPNFEKEFRMLTKIVFKKS